MPLYFRILFCAFFLNTIPFCAQFKFSGQTDNTFIDAKAYLIAIEDYKKCNLFLTEGILQEVPIDSLGNFEFSGDFLSKKNKFYKIHIDQCNNAITNYQHILNNCSISNSITFIANNRDSIHFPLNNMDQMFCSLEYSRIQNIAIQKIDSVQEILLFDLHNSKSENQRKIIFKSYFNKLQKYGSSFKDPLIALYVYQLYANRQSIVRDYYLTDLKNSDYYLDLLNLLKSDYPQSNYTLQYERDLQRDLPEFSVDKNNLTIAILVLILVLSIGINIYFLKGKRKKKPSIDYKKLLSPQELKVFELMHKGITNKEIAEQLFISLSTVKSHINTIYSKLSISSRKEIDQFFKQ